MELKHEFTVPASVEETWTAFNDIESVAACFPGAVVTSVEGDTFQGSCKVKLGPIALVYNGSGTFTEKDETARRMVIDAKGKDKRGNGTAGAHVTATMTEAGTGTRVEVAHRAGHHRQARPVRAGGDAGRQRQAARPVHRLPRAEGGCQLPRQPRPSPRSPSRRPGGGCRRRPTPTETPKPATNVRGLDEAPSVAGRCAVGRRRCPRPRRHGAAGAAEELLETGPRRAPRAARAEAVAAAEADKSRTLNRLGDIPECGITADWHGCAMTTWWTCGSTHGGGGAGGRPDQGLRLR